MRFIELTEKDKINVAEIDKQHESVASIISEIHDRLNSEEDEVQKLLKKLIEELEIHFETEEKLMKENRFPGYISHKLEHDRFYNQTLQSVKRYKENKSSLNAETLERIKRWFFNHLEINDRKCGIFLTSIGIS